MVSEDHVTLKTGVVMLKITFENIYKKTILEIEIIFHNIIEFFLIKFKKGCFLNSLDEQKKLHKKIQI